MAGRTIKSNPSASSELAIAAVNGLIGQEGNGKKVKVMNIDVREENGEYIAVAVIEVEELEAEQKKQEQPKPEEETRIGEFRRGERVDLAGVGFVLDQFAENDRLDVYRNGGVLQHSALRHLVGDRLTRIPADVDVQSSAHLVRSVL